jgi:catechol 2,3-dioxygenase-like lactoylglutathione lyase family enzyme
VASGRAIDHVVLAVRDLDRAATTYENLGFTLTPRAMHEDRMGTSNRLAQFPGRNFIELLEVDRPDRLQPHDLAGSPAFFSFGDHNRLALEEREGLSMLVFASEDARADLARFEAAGLRASSFDFERQAVLPDASKATVSFSLAFAWSPDMARVGFFSCQNRAQQFFWKPQYQTHANGAQSIAAIYLASPMPERDARFIGQRPLEALSAELLVDRLGPIQRGQDRCRGAGKHHAPVALEDEVCRAVLVPAAHDLRRATVQPGDGRPHRRAVGVEQPAAVPLPGQRDERGRQGQLCGDGPHHLGNRGDNRLDVLFHPPVAGIVQLGRHTV